MDPRNFFCRVCHGDLLIPPLLSYPDSPSSAQGFLDEPPEPGDSVCLDIYQCLACGLVQHPLEVVPYYKEVIRAIAFSDEMGRFRHVQLGEWITSKRLIKPKKRNVRGQEKPSKVSKNHNKQREATCN